MRTPDSNGEVTRRRVHEAAIEQFASNGFNATGLRQLAAAAGLTPGSIYNYISSKEDLLVEIMRSLIIPLERAATLTLPSLERADERLAALVELHVWIHASRAPAALVADTELRALKDERRAEVLDLRDGYERIWRTVVEEGVASGAFHTTEPRLVTIALLEMSTGVAHWYRPDGQRTLDDICRLHAGWALRMVDARVGAESVDRDDLTLPAPGDVFAEVEREASATPVAP